MIPRLLSLLPAAIAALPGEDTLLLRFRASSVDGVDEVAAYRGGGVVRVEHAADHRQQVGARFDQRARIVRRDAADRHPRQAQRGAVAQQCRGRASRMGLSGRGEEGAEGDVVRARRGGASREGKVVVAGGTEDRARRKRGPRGGYHLARPAYEIRLGDVVRALEGPIAITGREDGQKKAPIDGKDVTDTVFREISRRIEGCFDGVTIADMCRRGDELGLRKVREGYVYVI